MASIRALSGGRRRRRRTTSKRSKRSRRRSGSKRSRRRTKRRSGSAHKSAPISVSGHFTGYDVKNKKKVTINNPKLIKITKGKAVRAMISGTSALAPHGKVFTFISASDPKVSKHF